MSQISNTPPPPYYAVIFTSIRTDIEHEEYTKMATEMENAVKSANGFLGMESARDTIGITVSYWKDLESIRAWKAHQAHLEAQQLGKSKWYSAYKTRICKVERDYEM
jgi:heme-degrading monooxygenase HmoA